MQQPEPPELSDEDARAIEQRFTELMRRFWRDADRPEPDDQGDSA